MGLSWGLLPQGGPWHACFPEPHDSFNALDPFKAKTTSKPCSPKFNPNSKNRI